MALNATINGSTFSVGDIVKVDQKIEEGDKSRNQIFEGLVIGIRGRGESKSFTVRRIGAQNIGIERIFQLISPTINGIEVVRKGKRGIRRAKLYYTRELKSKKGLEEIYTRAKRKTEEKKSK